MIEMKEFDSITCNKEAGDLYGYKYLNKKAFEQLEQLVLRFNGSIDVDDAIDFLTISTKQNVGKLIRAKNYVGVLQVNENVQIEILPKIHGGTTEDTRKTFLKMLKTLKDFPSKSFN